MLKETVLGFLGSFLTLLLSISCGSSTQQGSSQAVISLAPAFSAEEFSATPRDGWMTNGGSVFNQRFSPLTQITPENVGNLKAVWRVHLGSGLEAKYSGEAQPIVHQGVIYIVTGADEVSAVGVKSGQVIWTYKANLDPSIHSVCCGWTSRGWHWETEKSMSVSWMASWWPWINRPESPFGRLRWAAGRRATPLPVLRFITGAW